MKFNVGDKVVKSNGNKWSNGDEYKTITKCSKFYGESRYELSNNALYWTDYELKFYVEKTQCIEPQTEFTFPEVVARNIPGIYVNCNDGSAKIKTVTVSKSGYIHIDAKLHETGENRGVLGIYPEVKFKLQESKKRVPIYKLEHQEDGKQYDFISSQLLYKDIFVICGTSQGKSYGKIVNKEYRELTESEIKQYKECWRA